MSSTPELTRSGRKSAVRVLTAGAAVVTVIAGLNSGAAFATSTSQAKAQQSKINGQISQLQNQLSEVSGQESTLLGQLDDINNKKSALEAQITDLQNQMNQAQADLDAANKRLNGIQVQMDAAQAKLKATQDALDASNKAMRDQAVDAYMGGQTDTNLAQFVLSNGDMREVGAESEYLQQVVQNRQDIVEQNRELKGEANDAKLAVKKLLDQATADRDTVAARQAQLNAQAGQLNVLHDQLQQQADAQGQLVQQIESQKATLQAQMDSLQAQSDSIGAMLRSLNTGGTPPPAGKGILANPVPGAPLTSPFGMRLDPVLGRYQLHAGQDFGVPTGTPIHAAADGTVVSTIPSASSGGYGNYTCINHGNGLATCYAHQSQFLVTPGQHVSRGQVIGLSGSTGYATGPHLHFEVRINGTPVNPLGYL